MLLDCVKCLSNAEDKDSLLRLNQVASAAVNWHLPSLLPPIVEAYCVCVCPGGHAGAASVRFGAFSLKKASP